MAGENNRQDDRIVYLNIDCESNYYNTLEQIGLRQTHFFRDTTSAAALSGSLSGSVSGLFSRNRVIKDDAQFVSSKYLTSSTVIDPSGSPRSILAGNNDFFASGSLDAYKNGVEITREIHWTAGLAKIVAGTPGHLYSTTLFGVGNSNIAALLETETFKSVDSGGSERLYLVASGAYESILDSDGHPRTVWTDKTARFYECSSFDPVSFIETSDSPTAGGNQIIAMGLNETENFNLNGIVEPLTIRPVVYGYSTYFPFEPHSFRGQFGGGNVDTRTATDQIVSVDYVSTRVNKTPFLDAVDMISMTAPGSSASLGVGLGYFDTGYNVNQFFVDSVPPRGVPVSSTYTGDLLSGVLSLPPQGSVYVSAKQRSATCGFVYDNAEQGTDSIAFGGLLY